MFGKFPLTHKKSTLFFYFKANWTVYWRKTCILLSLQRSASLWAERASSWPRQCAPAEAAATPCLDWQHSGLCTVTDSKHVHGLPSLRSCSVMVANFDNFTYWKLLENWHIENCIMQMYVFCCCLHIKMLTLVHVDLGARTLREWTRTLYEYMFRFVL